MFISILMLFASVFAAVPALTAKVFGEIEEYERLTIELDNSAIRLARSDRKLFRQIRVADNALRKLEIAHHVAHLCARTLSPAMWKCRTTDLAMERVIKATVEGLKSAAIVSWKQAEVRVHLDLSRAGWNAMRISREANPPLRFDRCPICGLSTRVAIEMEKAGTFFEGTKFSDSRIGVEFMNEADLDYRLHYRRRQ